MQYILSQEEYDALHAEQKQKQSLSTKKLQALCTEICNKMPVTWGWGGPDPKPWGCMLTAEKNGDEWYCDKCPVQALCPSDQSYSK